MDIETMGEGTSAVDAMPVISWDWYRDPRVLEVEERRLFRSSWQYVGPLERLSRPGDQIVGRVSRVPVVVVRDGDGELRGFLNVCRHRGSLVASADGNAPRLRCPYHAWTYNLDGTLRSAPQCGPQIEAELPALGLVPVRVATFGPFVFTNLSAGGPPLEAVLGDLAEIIAGVGIDLGGLRLRQRFAYELAANWKIHRAPVRQSPTSSSYSAAGSVTAGSYHLLLPNVKININPGRQNLSIGPVYPDGVTRTAGFLDYYFGADADDGWIEEMMAFDTDVGNEDATLVAAAQLGVSGSWIDRGRILPSERLLADFQRYVHAACADELPGLS